jgi:hypothetical protein
MSLFLQTLALRGILFSEQAHRQEQVNLRAGGDAPTGGAENGWPVHWRRGVRKRRIKTCIRRYEQHELFKLT